MRALALLAVLGGATAAEPFARLDWDQARLRAACQAHPLPAAWTAAAAAQRDERLARLPALLPGLPAPLLLWDGLAGGSLAWGEAGAAAARLRAGDLAPGLASGLAAWLGPGWTLAASAGEVTAVTAGLSPAGAPPPVGDAVVLDLDLRPLLARLLADAGVAVQVARWSEGGAPTATARLAIGADAAGWRARLAIAGGPRPRLHRPDAAFAAAIPERPLVLVAGIDPAAAGAALAEHGPAPVQLMLGLLGLSPASLARSLDGDIALLCDERRPRPRFLAVFGRTAGPDAGGVVGHLGDAFGGQPLALAGAERAWRVASPLGALAVAVTPRLVAVGDDEEALAALLVGSAAAPADIPAVRLAVAPALLAPWLDQSLAAWRWQPVADPLPGLLAQVHAAAWGLAQAGGRGPALAAGLLAPGRMISLRGARGVVQRFALAPATVERLAARCRRPAAALFADGVAVWMAADGARAVLALRTAPTRFLVVDGAGDGGTELDAAALAARVAGLEPVLGGAEGLAILDVGSAPVFDRACLPPVAAAGLPPYRLALHLQDAGWSLEERGLPLAGAAVLAGIMPAWRLLSAPAASAPVPTADL